MKKNKLNVSGFDVRFTLEKKVKVGNFSCTVRMWCEGGKISKEGKKKDKEAGNPPKEVWYDIHDWEVADAKYDGFDIDVQQNLFKFMKESLGIDINKKLSLIVQAIDHKEVEEVLLPIVKNLP